MHKGFLIILSGIHFFSKEIYFSFILSAIYNDRRKLCEINIDGLLGRAGRVIR
jgi:hypothetical protein